MRVAARPLTIGVPVLLALALAAFLALWLWGGVGGTGASSNAGLTWNVEYWQRSASGVLLDHQKLSNALTAVGKEAAMERLIRAGGGDLSDTGTTAQLQEVDTFDNIVLMNADDNLNTSGASGVGAADGIDSTQILQLVDGGTGNNAGQGAGGVKNNPADGAFTDAGGDGTGDGTVTLQFLADGNPDPATQMHLVKAAPDDTATAAADIVAGDILATIEITVDLADTDTLTITWVIDVN